MEFELSLLTLAQYILDGDDSNALQEAQKIGAIERDDDQESSLRSLFNDLFGMGDINISKDQAKAIMEATNLENGEAFIALTLFQLERSDGMSAKEFKTTEAYLYLQQDDPKFFDETEKFMFIRTLSLAAITTRDRELISFMLQKVNKYNA